MRVYIGADHGGYNLKEELKPYLVELGYEVEDLGAHSLVEDDDYPDYVLPVAEKVVGDGGSVGIVVGRSGNGEAIAANKVAGIRAAVCLNSEMARKAREHNDANVLSLGADCINSIDAKEVVKVFLETPFSGEERHIRRIRKITEYEAAYPRD